MRATWLMYESTESAVTEQACWQSIKYHSVKCSTSRSRAAEYIYKNKKSPSLLKWSVLVLICTENCKTLIILHVITLLIYMQLTSCCLFCFNVQYIAYSVQSFFLINHQFCWWYDELFNYCKCIYVVLYIPECLAYCGHDKKINIQNLSISLRSGLRQWHTNIWTFTVHANNKEVISLLLCVSYMML